MSKIVDTVIDFGKEIITINKRIKTLEERIKALESNVSDVPTAFSCKSCKPGKYKQSSGQWRINGIVYNRYECDSCGAEASQMQCKILDES